MRTFIMQLFDVFGEDSEVTVHYHSLEYFQVFFGDYKIRTLGSYKRNQVLEAIEGHINGTFKGL